LTNRKHGRGREHRSSDSFNDEERSRFKTLWREIRLLDIINTLIAIIMAIIAYATYHVASDSEDIKTAVNSLSDLANTSRESYISGRRAWISIVGPQQLSRPVEHQPIEARLNFQNTGGSPATEMAMAQIMHVVPKQGDGFLIPPNPECDSLHAPKQGGRTVFPNTEQPHVTTIPEGNDFVYPPEVIDRSKLLVWHGCFVYRTFGAEHRTNFCFWLRADSDEPTAQWHWDPCLEGNEAN
jgi:hypothetical protein